jgi:UTP--glucose-1-phosphate uridylyltransferase
MNINIPLLIPCAGLGSRLFPASWAVPKELFPLGNKPALHYILEEAILAQIKNVFFITSSRKEAITTYLSYKNSNNVIPLTNDESSRLSSLDIINNVLNYQFFCQNKANGVGDAMLCAYNELIKKDFFCMAYPDDILENQVYGLSSLMNVYKKYNCSVIAVEKVPADKINTYGVIKYDKEIESGIFNVLNIIEKPKIAPSEYGIVGRYVLSSEIIKIMKSKQEQPCFISALNYLLNEGKPILAILLETKRYDIGTPEGWIMAINGINNTSALNLYLDKNNFSNISKY